MRVGLIIYGSLNTVSGGYLYDRQLVHYLQDQGDQVDLITLPWRSFCRHLADNLSRQLYRRLRMARLDILLQDELNHPSLFWLNRRLQSTPFPIVSIVHHLRCSEARPAWQNRFYRWIEQRYLASVDAFVFNSQTTRAAVENLIGVPAHSIVAYPGGDRLPCDLSPEHIAARAKQPGPLRILFAGNVIPRKGLHTLIEALARLPERHRWQLDVAGSLAIDPAYTRAIHRQIARSGLDQQIRLHGSLPDAELANRMASSHVLAVPSAYEGFGIVYLEGMRFGLPAIASADGGAREIITHSQDGFLVEPGDSAALARCLDQLDRDRPRLLHMSLAARQRFGRHPTWARSAESTREFLQILAR